MLEGGAPKSKMKSLSLGIREMRSTALGARRRELMRVRLSCWVFTVMFVGGVAVKFVEEEVGRERARVERSVVRMMGVVVVYMFAVVMRKESLTGKGQEVFYKERKKESRVSSSDSLLTIKQRIVGIGNSARIPVCEL